MALIIITENKSYLSLWVILKRLSFILIPLSILFIKYYPQLGRAYHVDGTAMYVGVTSQKNQLGMLCLVLGIIYVWNLLFGKKDEFEKSSKIDNKIYIIILPMIAWLFYLSNSATSYGCMAAALGLFVVAKFKIFNNAPNKLITSTIIGIIFIGFIQLLFNIKDPIIEMLGRRPDLTTRVPMWQDLLSMVKNPLIGYGYESFWLGKRMIYIQANYGRLVQAHNGYIEMYLNMGAIGIFFIIAWVVSGLRHINKYISTNYSYGILRYCFVIVMLMYNYTEATFYGVSTLWLLFFIGISTIPEQQNIN
jgi:O-antigen ligase